MKSFICLAFAVASLLVCLPGCETYHEETTKQNVLGGTTHKETTTTHNPITGNTTVESSKQVTH